MAKKEITEKSILTVGAAAAFCGATLYALGQTLSFLFRDVDPDRIEKKGDIEAKAEDAETAEDAEAEEKIGS